MTITKNTKTMTQILFFSTFDAARQYAADRNLFALPEAVHTDFGEESGFRFETSEHEIVCYAAVRERRFWIRDRQAGNKIDWFPTLEAAIAEREAYENVDKEEGFYEKDFYEIVEDDSTDFEDLPNDRQTKF